MHDISDYSLLIAMVEDSGECPNQQWQSCYEHASGLGSHELYFVVCGSYWVTWQRMDVAKQEGALCADSTIRRYYTGSRPILVSWAIIASIALRLSTNNKQMHYIEPPSHARCS